MRAKSNANKRKTTANPLKLLGLTVESAESRCAISVPFNNESREKAITNSPARRRPVRPVRFVCTSKSMPGRRKVPLFFAWEGEDDDSVVKKNAIDFNADCVSAIFNR
jgi:hypothetical protein